MFYHLTIIKIRIINKVHIKRTVKVGHGNQGLSFFKTREYVHSTVRALRGQVRASSVYLYGCTTQYEPLMEARSSSRLHSTALVYVYTHAGDPTLQRNNATTTNEYSALE